MIFWIVLCLIIWFVVMPIAYIIAESVKEQKEVSGIYAFVWPAIVFIALCASPLIFIAFIGPRIPVAMLWLVGQIISGFSKIIKYLSKKTNRKKIIKRPEIECSVKSSIPDNLEIITPEEYRELKKKVDKYGEKMGRNYG
jgi:hypothetical protein